MRVYDFPFIIASVFNINAIVIRNIKYKSALLFFSFAKRLFITLQSILLPRLVVIGLELYDIALFVYIQFSGDFQLFLVYLLHFLYLLHLGLFLKDHLGSLELLFDLFSNGLSNIVLLKHFGPD